MFASPFIPPVDVSTLQAAVESLRVDLYMILKSRVPESEAPFAELAEDTVLATLFSTVAVPPPPPSEHAKRCGVRDEYEGRAHKRERREWRLRGEPRFLMRRPIS